MKITINFKNKEDALYFAKILDGLQAFLFCYSTVYPVDDKLKKLVAKVAVQINEAVNDE